LSPGRPGRETSRAGRIAGYPRYPQPLLRIRSFSIHYKEIRERGHSAFGTQAALSTIVVLDAYLGRTIVMLSRRGARRRSRIEASPREAQRDGDLVERLEAIVDAAAELPMGGHKAHASRGDSSLRSE
jgi:hypothetical protein